MRTIRLQEQESQTVRLSPTELTRLVTCRHLSVEVVDGAQQLYRVRAGSVVGTLVWRDLTALIRPKVHIRNVLFLLGYRPRLAHWCEDPFLYAEESDLLRVMSRFLEAEVRHGLRYGLVRDYVARELALTTVRGRVATGRQLRQRQTQPIPLECDFEEYAVDITLNRVLKAALRRLRVVAGLDRTIALALRRAEGSFADVADVDFAPAEVPDLAFTRLTERWRTAFRLAQMVLRSESLRDEAGSIQGIAFTVDMNAVFEKFVEEVVADEARRAGLLCRPQARERLTAEIEMRPDLVLMKDGRQAAVADAKYIDLEPDGWRNANLYQLLAYCIAMRLPRGLLVYASARTTQTYRLLTAEIDFEVTGVDLTQRPEVVDYTARQVARRLIDHAHSSEQHQARSSQEHRGGDERGRDHVSAVRSTTKGSG